VEELLDHTLIHRDGTMSAASRGKRFHSTTRSWILIFDTIYSWRERARQRRALASLPDYMLSDIGVSRIDAWREAEKPFWQA
jgi:uncharacterized protein YjiS (DUF1127 family)